MKKTIILTIAATLCPMMTIAQSKPAPTDVAPAAKTAKLTPEQVHRNALVVDTHEDTPQRLLDDHFDFSDPLNGGQINLDAIHKGNLGASFMSIWVEPDLYKGQYAKRTLELIDSVYQQAAKHPDNMQMAFSSAGILAAHRNHKLAALMGIRSSGCHTFYISPAESRCHRHQTSADLRLLHDSTLIQNAGFVKVDGTQVIESSPCLNGSRTCGRKIPGQQVINAVNWMVGDARQDSGEARYDQSFRDRRSHAGHRRGKGRRGNPGLFLFRVRL